MSDLFEGKFNKCQGCDELNVNSGLNIIKLKTDEDLELQDYKICNKCVTIIHDEIIEKSVNAVKETRDNEEK